MKCKLPTSEKGIHTDQRPELVYFASHDIIVYRDLHLIKLASCGGELLAQVPVPANHNVFDYLELDDSILFMFGGFQMVWMDKNGLSPTTTELHPLKIGKCITPMFASNDDNRVIFGTKKLKKIQFINYDFIEHSRKTQTSSWEVSDVTSIFVNKSTVYAILDYSTIVACDMATGETLWTRFETARIQRGIFPVDGFLYYTSQGLLKKTDGNTQKTIRIPLVTLNSLEHTDGKSLYFSSKDGKNLCKYDLISEKVIWEIHGQYPIEESVLIQNEDKENLLLTRTENYIGIINLDKGKAETNIRTSNITKLRNTSDHVLIYKRDGTTVLVPGIENG